MLRYDKCLRETELYLEKNVNNSNNAEGKIATKTNVESDALTVIFFFREGTKLDLSLQCWISDAVVSGVAH